MLDAGIAISAHNGDNRASLTSGADCSTRWPGETAISTTVAGSGAATESVAVIAASLVRREIAASERPLSRSICRRSATAMLACRASVWLVSTNALRHRLAFEQVGVSLELLGGKNVLRGGMQIVALQRHEARALQGDERLTQR